MSGVTMNTTLPFDTEVLVIGAGPTGLTAAAQLAERGVSVRIIDAAPVRSDKSRALAVQARTLELLDKMGLAQPLIERGQRTTAVNVTVDGKPITRVAIGELGIDHTPFPYLLFVSQVETERVLEGHLTSLGVEIDRPVRLLGLSQDDHGVTARLDRDGVEQTVRARYLLGADGAHSAVRHQLALPFDGDAYDTEFILGDVRITGDVPRTELSLFIGRKGVVMVFPMGTDHIRVMATGYRIHRDGPLLLDELQQQTTLITGRPSIRLSDPTWLSRFRLHHRGVDRYGVGRVFLAGDAAHIHSPAGGQGMNTGIQDAFNLAWKLAMVLRGQARPELLESYEAERLPVGRKLLSFTDRLFSLMSTTNSVTTWLRSMLAPIVMPRLVDGQRSRAFTFASQTGIRYRRSPVVAEHLEGSDRRFRAGPRAGDRAPSIPLPAGHLMTRMGGTGWWLVALTGRGADAVDAERLRARAEAACVNAPWIRPLVVSSANDAAEAVLDPEGLAHQRYGLSGPGLVLVRPDGHIAFRSAGAGIDPLCRWLDDWTRAAPTEAPRALPAPTVTPATSLG